MGEEKKCVWDGGGGGGASWWEEFFHVHIYCDPSTSVCGCDWFTNFQDHNIVFHALH